MDAYSRELRWFAEQSSFKKSVARAAIARGPRGTRLAHQRRLKRRSLVLAHQILVANLRALSSSISFSDLHYLIQQLLVNVPNLGSVYFYDTALRIGAYLSNNGNHYPVDVFLHQGSLEGARAISSVRPFISSQNPLLKTKVFPSPLSSMSPHELENLLCIYKSCLT